MIDVNGLFSRSRLWTASSLLDFTPLSKAQKDHLTKVYATLAVCAVITFLGASIPLRYFSFHPSLLGFTFLGCMAYVIFTSQRYGRSDENRKIKRMSAVAVMALAQGLLMRELVLFMIYVNPEIITNALFATVAIFTCFSVGSLFMNSRVALYLGGLAVSLSLYVSMVRLANYFIGSKFADDVSDVVMLVSFCGFVIFDTQVTLKEFSSGSNDYLLHSVMLYGDIVNIFLKIVKILYEKEKKKEEDSDSRRKL